VADRHKTEKGEIEMANSNRKICKTLPKQTFDYHSRKCVICRHPDRAAIESAS
jgi:hypothetical protein